MKHHLIMKYIFNLISFYDMEENKTCTLWKVTCHHFGVQYGMF
jgi:hypothetical protein